MTAVTSELVPPKRILVNGKPIRLRWVQQIIWSFLAANIGALIISALYYLFTQLNWHIAAFTLNISWAHIHWHYGGAEIMNLKPKWDYLFSFQGWKADRHDFRNVYEALLATLFVRSLLANWRKHDRRAPDWYVAISPLLIIVVALPFVAAGVWLINYGLPDLWHLWLAHHTLHNPVHFPQPLAWLGTYLSGWVWQPVVIGILAGLVVHRVYAPAGNTVQLYFVGRSVDRTRDAIAAGEQNPSRHLPRWPWPPVVRERAAWIMQNDLPVPDRSRNIKWAVWIFSVVFGGLAIYGGYVRYWIAKGH
jgi:hypothetical protein